MNRRHARLAALFAVVFTAATVHAQLAPAPAPAAPPAAKPTAEQVAAAIDTLRMEVASVRKQTVAANMTFTDKEATAFWPVYDAYRLEMKSARDGEWTVIQAYAANQSTMSDTLAQRLITTFIAARKSESDIHAAYAPKFAAVLGWTKTFRFLQIENKLDAIQDFNRARQIPLLTK